MRVQQEQHRQLVCTHVEVGRAAGAHQVEGRRQALTPSAGTTGTAPSDERKDNILLQNHH